MLHGTMFGGGMWFGWIFWAVLLGAIIYFSFRKQSHSSGSELHAGETAIEILRRRYANGELSEEEYNRIKNEII